MLEAYVTRSIFQQWSKTDLASCNELFDFSESNLQATYGDLLIRSSYKQSDQILQRWDRLSKLQRAAQVLYRFLISVTDYYTVKLASAAKLTQYSLRGKREVVLQMEHRGETSRVLKLLWYSSGRAVISDTTLSNSNTRHE